VIVFGMGAGFDLEHTDDGTALAWMFDVLALGGMLHELAFDGNDVYHRDLSPS